jgi:hypothetical protein
MMQSDKLGLAMAVSFGLWWLIAPSSVLRFYNWFHRGRVQMPKTSAIRFMGLIWVVLIIIVLAAAAK